MADLNFPQDRSELVPSKPAGPLQTGDTYTANGTTWVYDADAGAWGSGTGAVVDTIYLSRVNDDTAEGEITFDAGLISNGDITIEGVKGATSLATDANGKIIVGTGAGNQDLAYVADGNSAGQVTITDGTPATIPVATDSVAGLFTGAQKQKLDGLNTTTENDSRYLRLNAGNSPVTGACTFNSTVTSVGGLRAEHANGVGMKASGSAPTSVLRSDTNSFYVLTSGTASNNINMSYNSLRPIAIKHSSGQVEFGHSVWIKDSNALFTCAPKSRFGDAGSIATVCPGTKPSIYASASASTRWGVIGLPSGSQLFNSVSASNAFGGAADAQTVALFNFTDNANNSKELVGLYSRSGGTNKTMGIIRVNHNRQEARYSTDGAYGMGFACKSTAGANQAACLTLYSRTGSTEYQAGFIKAGGENNGAFVRITSTNGSAPATTFETDTRNIVSTTPLPSAVNLVKALNPSLIELNNGNTVVSFPFDTTKLNVNYAAIGTGSEVTDEGEPEFAGVDHGRLVPLLTKALQEALTEIDGLKTRLDALEGA